MWTLRCTETCCSCYRKSKILYHQKFFNEGLGIKTEGPLLQNILFICWTHFFFLFCNRWSLNLFCNNSNRKRMRFPLKTRDVTIGKTSRTKVLAQMSPEKWFVMNILWWQFQVFCFVQLRQFYNLKFSHIWSCQTLQDEKIA